jgi:hypothetical protein
MTKFEIHLMNLDVALFKAVMPVPAMQVVLNTPASDNEYFQSEILGRVLPSYLPITAYRIRFERMLDMLEHQNHMDNVS